MSNCTRKRAVKRTSHQEEDATKEKMRKLDQNYPRGSEKEKEINGS